MADPCDEWPGDLAKVCRGEFPGMSLETANAHRAAGMGGQFKPLPPLERLSKGGPLVASKPAPDGISWIWAGINFGSAMMKWAGAGFPVRTKKEIKRIFAICKECPQFSNGHCNQCGCLCNENSLVVNKIAVKTESCPIGNW